MTPKKKEEIQLFLEFCNFYQRFIDGLSRTAKPLYKRIEKEARQQMGMGGQGTTSIRRNEAETHYGPGTGPLQPLGTTYNRDRRLEIRLFWDPITTMRGRQMEASHVSVQDNETRRMQPRHPR